MIGRSFIAVMLIRQPRLPLLQPRLPALPRLVLLIQQAARLQQALPQVTPPALLTMQTGLCSGDALRLSQKQRPRLKHHQRRLLKLQRKDLPFHRRHKDHPFHAQSCL